MIFIYFCIYPQLLDDIFFDINNESNTFLKNVAFEISNGFVITQYKMVYESKVRAFVINTFHIFDRIDFD